MGSIQLLPNGSFLVTRVVVNEETIHPTEFHRVVVSVHAPHGLVSRFVATTSVGKTLLVGEVSKYELEVKEVERRTVTKWYDVPPKLVAGLRRLVDRVDEPEEREWLRSQDSWIPKRKLPPFVNGIKRGGEEEPAWMRYVS